MIPVLAVVLLAALLLAAFDLGWQRGHDQGFRDGIGRAARGSDVFWRELATVHATTATATNNGVTVNVGPNAYDPSRTQT